MDPAWAASGAGAADTREAPRTTASSPPSAGRCQTGAPPPPTDPLHLNRVADLPIQLHELHPQPSAFNAESLLLLEFYSGAAGPPGRFSEGFLLRRLQTRIGLSYGPIARRSASCLRRCRSGAT